MANIHEVGFKFVKSLGEELSQGTVELPAFPDVALRIKNALEDPDVSAGQVAKVVGSDPVFSARLLKVANSVAIAGGGKPIADIPAAIARIGFKMAHNIAVSIAVNQLMNAGASGQLEADFKKLWRHSVNVAAYSFVIAKKIAKINPDKALLGGLMHDIGKIYILSRTASDFPELCDDPAALGAVLREWHTGVGSAILQNWDFDEELVMVADEHELYDRDVMGRADLTDVVLAANLFAHVAEQEPSPDDPAEQDWVAIGSFKRLKIDEASIAVIKEESREEVNSIIAALGS